MIDEHDPWFFALKAERSYLISEDIRSCLDAGASRSYVQQVVLQAIARRQCEDPSLCAFVASEPGV